MRLKLNREQNKVVEILIRKIGSEIKSELILISNLEAGIKPER
jgi:hypothetical protein